VTEVNGEYEYLVFVKFIHEIIPDLITLPFFV